eukprot:jgi/Orpsp1_1/1191970/evm.model.d7180000089739.1
MNNNEPDSPSNPFSDCHSTNSPIDTNKPISIKERSHFFEQQAQNNYQNNVLKSPTLRPQTRNTPLSPKIRQSQTFYQQQKQTNTFKEGDKRSSYLNNNVRNDISSIYTNNITNNIQTSDIDNPFSDSNKIAPSPSDEVNSGLNNYLDPNSGQRNSINKPPSPLVPNKPLALRTSPRISVNGVTSPILNPPTISVSSANKRVNDAGPQTVGLSNDFKKLHLNITKNSESTITNPFSPVDTTPTPLGDELGSGTSPLINSGDKKHDKHKKHESYNGKKRMSIRSGHFKHNKDKTNSLFSTHQNYNEQEQEFNNDSNYLTNNNNTLSPESIESNQIYSNSITRPVPIPKASTVSGGSPHSFRQSLQMPILEPSPASKLRAANIQHSSTNIASKPSTQPQQPPPIPERPNLHNIQHENIHTNNTISNHNIISNHGTISSHYPGGNNFGDKIASRRAVINIDTTKSNRAAPTADGYNKIELPKHPKCISFCGQYLYAGVSNLSVYNAKTGMPSNIVAIDEKIKITSILLVPGQYLVDEGNIVWAGTDKGAIYEIDNSTSRIKYTRNISSFSIIDMFYSGNKIWVISEKSVAIWTRSENNNTFSLENPPSFEYSLADIPEFDISYVLDDKLWLCSQKTLTAL